MDYYSHFACLCNSSIRYIPKGQVQLLERLRSSSEELLLNKSALLLGFLDYETFFIMNTCI